MKLPSVYENPGYERARELNAAMAESYVAHTVVGDPVADAAVAALAGLGAREVAQFIRAGMDGADPAALRDAPRPLVEFFEHSAAAPGWLDPQAFEPGIRLFHRNTTMVLGGMVGGTLVEGFSTNISKSFFITGRLRDQGVRRLRQNNRHMLEIFIPGGLERYGDGWKLSVRIRLVHAQVRHLLAGSEDWDAAAWGVPLSAAHVGFAITAFSARLLQHMGALGAEYTDDEAAGFMQVWRYSGYLMGIPESILFNDMAGALNLYEIGRLCEPEPGVESAVMANALVNSAPLVAGTTDPAERRDLARYVYSISRALIGNTLADQLNYPRTRILGVLRAFRIQTRLQGTLARLIPKRSRRTNYANFTSMLDASMYDEEGIQYRMPDHVYSEESSSW